MFLQHPPQIQSVLAFAIQFDELFELAHVDEALVQGDFFETGDFETLPLLERLDEYR